MTRQCCHGYARNPQKLGPNALCEKVELLSFQDTVEKYGTPEFIAILKNNNVSEKFGQNSTLLLPLHRHGDSQQSMIDDANNSTAASNTTSTTTTTSTTLSSPRDVAIIFDHFVSRY